MFSSELFTIDVVSISYIEQTGPQSFWLSVCGDVYVCVGVLQVSDGKMQKIRELKAKFEEDKKRIQEMRKQRKFKPY